MQAYQRNSIDKQYGKLMISKLTWQIDVIRCNKLTW
jgi:hypothetical protein